MIGKLVFKLPEEEEEFRLAQNSQKYLSVLRRMDNYMRNKIKYTEEKPPETWVELRTVFRELINTYDIEDL